MAFGRRLDMAGEWLSCSGNAVLALQKGESQDWLGVLKTLCWYGGDNAVDLDLSGFAS